jgi:hypothetical protein
MSRRKKYTHLNTEAEAIELAIQANTSSRPKNHSGQNLGGNGLYSKPEKFSEIARVYVESGQGI